MKYAFEAMVKDFEREPVIQRYARQRNIHRDPSDPLACKAVVTWKKIDGVQIAICPVHEEVVNVYVTYEE